MAAQFYPRHNELNIIQSYANYKFRKRQNKKSRRGIHCWKSKMQPKVRHTYEVQMRTIHSKGYINDASTQSVPLDN